MSSVDNALCFCSVVASAFIYVLAGIGGTIGAVHGARLQWAVVVAASAGDAAAALASYSQYLKHYFWVYLC